MAVHDKAKIIDGGATEITIRVGDDGVWLGFFTKDGASAVINVDEWANVYPPGSERRAALSAWAADRRHQAAHLPA